MVRRHPVLIVLGVLLAPTLAACAAGPDFGSDASDLDAAVAVWSDPWVAPTSATVAGPALGSNGQVSRVVARRTTTYAAGFEEAVRAELRAATEAGWVPTSSTCGDAVQIALRGPEDAVAQLDVAADSRQVRVSVQVAVPHHLDDDWAAPAPIGASCVDGDATIFEAPPFQSAPLGDTDADDERAEWSAASAADVVKAAGADPALAALGVEVTAPTLREGVNRRRAPVAEADTAIGSLEELVSQLPGWDLTYVACGGTAPVRATFVNTGLPAVLAAEVRPGGTTLRVTLPVPEGPQADWLDDLERLDPATCPGSDAPAAPTTYGTPAVLPTELTPITD